MTPDERATLASLCGDAKRVELELEQMAARARKCNPEMLAEVRQMQASCKTLYALANRALVQADSVGVGQ